MGCGGGPEDPTQEIDLTYKGNEIDNGPYEGMQKVATADAWKIFTKTDHKPPEEDGPEPSTEVEELTELKSIGKGDAYLGSFDSKGNKPEGFGIMAQKETGNIHQGYFTKGKAEGPGILFLGKGPMEGAKIVSHFKDGSYEGLCKIVYPNGTEYLGDIKKRQRQGKGKETTKGGDVYEGKWVKDSKEGWGKLTKKDGSSYEGQWKNNKPEGVGKSIDKNGSEKYREFSRGQPTKKEVDPSKWESLKPEDA